MQGDRRAYTHQKYVLEYQISSMKALLWRYIMTANCWWKMTKKSRTWCDRNVLQFPWPSNLPDCYGSILCTPYWALTNKIGMYLPTIFSFLIDWNCRPNGRGLVESWCWRWGDSNISAGARLSQRVWRTEPGAERWRKTERVHDRREEKTIGFRIQKRRNRRSRCPEHADESLSHSG